MFYYTIKKAIKESGKTYREVAERAGINLSTLVRLSQAQTSKDYNLCLRTLDGLCNSLDVKPDVLINYKSTPKRKRTIIKV